MYQNTMACSQWCCFHERKNQLPIIINLKVRFLRMEDSPFKKNSMSITLRILINYERTVHEAKQ